MHHPWRTLILLWLVLLTIGIAVVGWGVFQSRQEILSIVDQKQRAGGNQEEQPSDTFSPESLQAEVASLSAQVQQLTLQATAAGSTKTVVVNNTTTTVTPPASSGKVREEFLPMGGGSTNNRDWTNMTAAQIMFDPKKFGQVMSVRFEAAGSIIGGEVHARLIDVTHNVIYYNTELVMNTSTPTWVRSAKFSIPNSPATYQVQLLSTSGETAYLEGSRLVIESKY
ncbi:hypothetical protein H3C66_01665 [Patescibacteria group bacterium]|nr:hypothetical protein [Patescibacteria group bacterium]